MVNLILDTNIWIYLAEGQHTFVLNGIVNEVDNQNIILLVNQEIINEWNRNRDKNRNKTITELFKKINNTKKLANCLENDNKEIFKNLIEKIANIKIEEINNRYSTVDNLIKNKSKIIPIKEEHKLTAINWALNHKAPFHKNKNSVADALIVLSAISYIKENGINNVNYNRIEISDSIFVSYNCDDFSKGIKENEKNVIHPDLKPFLDSVGMKYERNFGKILKLTSDMKVEIDEYLLNVENCIIEQIEWEHEIKRGR